MEENPEMRPHPCCLWDSWLAPCKVPFEHALIFAVINQHFVNLNQQPWESGSEVTLISLWYRPQQVLEYFSIEQN
jgi:hypothetical protein